MSVLDEDKVIYEDIGDGTFEIECNCCGNTEYIDECDIDDLEQALVDIGWVVTFYKHNWWQFCSNKCEKEFKGE